jgi:hypothetical protein
MNYDKLKMDTYFRTYDALRGMMSPASMPIGILFIAEAKNAFVDAPDDVTEYELYSFIDDRAAYYGTRNVFPTSKDAFRIYNLMRDINEVDWEEVLGRLDYQARGLIHVPQVINKLFIERIQPDVKSVLICEGEKFTPYLHRIVDANPDASYTITTANEAYQTMLEYAFEDYANVSVVFADIYSYGFNDRRYDLILSVPNFGKRMVVDFDQTFMCREFEMVAAENLLFHLNSNGRLMIVLPARATYAAGNVKQLRDFIQDMYKLEEIAELPEGCFEGIGIKAYLFSITTGITDDVTVRRYIAASTVTGSGGRIPQELKMSEETFVMASELAEQGDWNIDKVFAAQDADWQKFMNVKKIALRDVAQVFRGKNVPQKDPTGNIGVVNISNLKEYTIDYDSLDHYSCEERKLVSYILEDGDIIIPARGTALRTAVFKKQPYTCIASSNLIVIRPRKDLLNSTYLKMFFDSPLGNKLLSSAQQGTTVINISYRDIQYIEIPLPEKSRQDVLAEEYEQELKIYLDGIREAEDRWNSVLNRLQEEL